MARILAHHHVLAVHDVRRSADFYVAALGFEVVDEPHGWIFVARDGVVLMLGECPDDMAPSELGCHSYFAYLRVDDADALHAEVAASGRAPRLSSVEDKPWGMREFALTTVDGHRLTVGHPIREAG